MLYDREIARLSPMNAGAYHVNRTLAEDTGGIAAMNAIKAVNLALRFLLELAAVVAFGYWGFHTGGSTVARVVLGVGSPVLAAVVWGLFVAPKAAMTLPSRVKFVLGLAILLLAAVALAAAGQPAIAVAFAAIVVINQVLLVLWHQ